MPPDTPAAGLGVDQLASLGRTIAFNDFQAGGTASAYGEPKDRNVELVLDDPRATRPADPKLRLRCEAAGRGSRPDGASGSGSACGARGSP